MLRIQKNNIDKWKLLLKVLSDELPENDSYFQRWLNEDPANKSLYKSLKEGQGDDALFDKEQVFRNISNKLSLNTTRKTGWHQTVNQYTINGGLITTHKPELFSSVADIFYSLDDE